MSIFCGKKGHYATTCKLNPGISGQNKIPHKPELPRNQKLRSDHNGFIPRHNQYESNQYKYNQYRPQSNEHKIFVSLGWPQYHSTRHAKGPISDEKCLLNNNKYSIRPQKEIYIVNTFNQIFENQKYRY